MSFKKYKMFEYDDRKMLQNWMKNCCFEDDFRMKNVANFEWILGKFNCELNN